ncbi:MAG: hypothetical protein K5697_13650 [Lachnospiraceae bacterium]|nr:hypothetical protein [Lachnospiraceae bacterium]
MKEKEKRKKEPGQGGTGTGKVSASGGLPAMMTLEAVVILPFCLIVSIAILWIGMLLYNRTAVDYALSVAVIQGGRQAEKENDEIVSLVRKKAEELLQGRLVLMDAPSLTVSVDMFEVKAELHGRMKAPPLPLIGNMSITADWSVESEKTSPRLKESMIVRTLK